MTRYFAPGIAVGLMLLLALVLVGCGDSADAREGPPERPPAAVTVAQPVVREVVEWDEYLGRLEAVETVEVRARVGGYVQSVNFAAGSVVREGDLLFVIDPRPFKAAFDAADARVKQAEANVSLAQTEFDRIERLRPSGAVSQQEFDTRRFELLRAQAAVLEAQAAAETARLELEWTQVRAPITGQIGREQVTPGNLITGGSVGATLLTTIASQDPMYAYIDADERSVLKYIALRRAKQRVSARDQPLPAMIRLEDGSPGREGVVDFVNNRVDASTGTLRARVILPNPGAELLPGLTVRVRIPGSGRYRAVLVAEEAILADQSRRNVMVVNRQTNQVEPRSVVVGASFGQLRAITSGLTGDEWIIVNGLMQARPGAAVNPQEGAMPHAEAVDQLINAGSPTTRQLPTTREVQEAPAPQEGAPSSSSPAPQSSRAGDAAHAAGGIGSVWPDGLLHEAGELVLPDLYHADAQPPSGLFDIVATVTPCIAKLGVVRTGPSWRTIDRIPIGPMGVPPTLDDARGGAF